MTDADYELSVVDKTLCYASCGLYPGDQWMQVGALFLDICRYDDGLLEFQLAIADRLWGVVNGVLHCEGGPGLPGPVRNHKGGMVWGVGFRNAGLADQIVCGQGQCPMAMVRQDPGELRAGSYGRV